MLEMLRSVDWKAVAAPFLTYLISGLVVYAVIPSLGKIPSATGKFFDWLKDKASHTKNQYAAGVLMRASMIVRDIVIGLENTEIEAIKDLAAAGRYKTKEDLLADLKIVKERAISDAKSHLMVTDLMKDLTTIFMGDGNALTKWLGDQVETHVATLPPSGLQTTGNPEISAVASGLKAADHNALTKNLPSKPNEAAPVVAPEIPPKAAS
jgi:hypothetical protein